MQNAKTKEFFVSIKEKLKNFFKTRGLGFYFTAAAALFALLQAIVYAVAFSTPLLRSYGDWKTLLFSFVGIGACIVLACFSFTENYSPVAVGVFELLSFYNFIYSGYMYFSTLFYSGITWKTISLMHYGYWASILFYLLAFGASIAAVFTKQSERPQDNAAKAEEANAV